MKTIYMVEGTCGEYSDRSEWSICAFTDEDKAKSLVAKLLELEKFNNSFRDRIKNEWEANYVDELLPPRPSHPAVPEGFKEAQDACSRGNGSQEIKSKLNALQKVHQFNVSLYKEEYEAWKHLENEAFTRKQASKDAWFKENYIVPEHLVEARPFIRFDGNGWHSYYDTNYYHYAVTLYE